MAVHVPKSHVKLFMKFDNIFLFLAARVLEHSAAAEKFSRRKLRQPFSNEMSSNDTRTELTSQTDSQSQQSEDCDPMTGSDEEVSAKRSKRIKKRIQRSFACKYGNTLLPEKFYTKI